MDRFVRPLGPALTAMFGGPPSFAFPPLAFAEPAILAALAILPLLWWLLRATPPAPRRQSFPALRLLRDLSAPEETPARTPWWVLLLRLVIAALVILALSGPVANPDRPLTGSGPLVLVLDDGWAAAPDWPARRAAALEAVSRADRSGRDIWLLPTAPPAGGGPLTLTGPLTPAAARDALAGWVPKPWPTDRDAALRALAAHRLSGSVNAIWIADPLAAADPASDRALGTALQASGGLEILRGTGDALLLRPPRAEGAALAVTVERAAAGPAAGFALRALAADGRTLLRQEGLFPEGATAASLVLDLPLEARNALERIEIEGAASAGAVVLLDDRWRRRSVGIVADVAAGPAQPLLSPTYYLERALAPFAELRADRLDALLAPPPGRGALDMIVLPDAGPLTESDRAALSAWVEAGGVALRFAGPLFAANPDPLGPVALRGGDRQLAGALAWTTPMAVAPFPDTGPFRGLAVPQDIRVERQVLADPAAVPDTDVWARLTDGTPLVTGAARGQGWLVLVHTAAEPSWSSLPLSGLFVDMLRRLAALGEGAAAAASDTPRPPLILLDGFGRPTTATGSVRPLTAIDAARAGPDSPPGLYGRGEDRVALNLSAGLPPPAPLSPPPGASLRPLTGTGELPLAPWLLAAALLLFAIDLFVALALRGLLRRRGAMAAGLVLALGLGLLQLPEARAQEVGQDIMADPAGDPAAAADRVHLAYVVTGDAAVDATSRAGLDAMARVVRDRTSADTGPPVAVDPSTDELAFYPLLYWPVTGTQPAPDEAALDNLDLYLARGGIIVFDTRDDGTGGATADLQRLTAGLAVPPLETMPVDHVLTRTFYLLGGFQGRTANAPVWVAATDATRHDGISPVIVSGADLAAAWATDGLGRPLFPVEPGGERQREMAYRAGVNLVLYALTGNYKSDQVHVPAILERLGEVR